MGISGHEQSLVLGQRPYISCLKVGMKEARLSRSCAKPKFR